LPLPWTSTGILARSIRGEFPVIELVNPKDARAVRNKDNVLAVYDLMINQKEAEQAVAKFFAPR
jgi:hypothetical protein